MATSHEKSQGCRSGWHLPVLLEETLEQMCPRAGGTYVDGTVGDGGHAEAILEASSPDGRLLALDRDPQALERAGERLARFGDRVILRHSSFADLGSCLEALGWDAVDGLLIDLGVSSRQLDEADRGFSFSRSGPLDMRMDPSRGVPASQWLQDVDEDQLGRILRDYGEQPQPRRMARAILRAVRAGGLSDTGELARVVARAAGSKRSHHPATQTFQAIRIAVNGELEELERFLAEAWKWLRPGARLVVLAYHSLEDRRVKNTFRRWSKSCLCPRDIPVCRCGWSQKVKLLTRRPIRSSRDEVSRNPRARSARLRAVERVAA